MGEIGQVTAVGSQGPVPAGPLRIHMKRTSELVPRKMEEQASFWLRVAPQPSHIPQRHTCLPWVELPRCQLEKAEKNSVGAEGGSQV